MAHEDIIDLDKLLPEPKKIKLNGRIIELYPGKLKTLIKLQRAFLAFQNTTTDQQDGLFDEVVDVLSLLIPALKEDDMDITLSQLPILIEVAYKASMPEAKAEAKTLTTSQKKTEDSPEQ